MSQTLCDSWQNGQSWAALVSACSVPLALQSATPDERGRGVLQEGTADSLQLIRGTDEEQKADFIAKQMGCAPLSVSIRAYNQLVSEQSSWCEAQGVQDSHFPLGKEGPGLQAIQDRLDLHPEHKGEGLHHVFRRDLSDSRSAASLASSADVFVVSFVRILDLLLLL